MCSDCIGNYEGFTEFFLNPIALLRPLPPGLYIYHPPVSARRTAPPDKSMANTNIVMPSGD